MCRLLGPLWRTLCCCGLLFISIGLRAENPVQLLSKERVINLSPSVSILRETAGKLTIDEVKNQLALFTPDPSGNPNYGFSDQGIWLHFSLNNVTTTKDWVLEVGFPQLDNVDMYVLRKGKVIAASYQGKEGTPQRYRLPTMKILLPYAETTAILVRVMSEHSSLVVPLEVKSQLLHEKANFYDNLLWGMFYGGLLILAIYNFVLCVANREKSLLAYLGYIGTVLLWQFVWGGHMNIMFQTDVSHWFHLHSDIIFVLLGISSGIFTHVFLEAPLTAPKSMLLIKLNIFLLAVMGLLSVLNIFPPIWQNAAVYLLSMFAIACYTLAGFESYANKFHAARYFIFAWSVLATCALIGLLGLSGLLPSNFFTAYCFHMGVFIQATLFSLALMDKSRHQLELEVRQVTDDLRNNIELVEEQNVRLDLARKDAVAASHVKSQFLANMSHEIRTPLNAILGFSKELQLGNLPAEKNEHVNIINAAADNLLSIVNDVLDVSKIEAGKLRINNHPFSPNELLEDMLGVMAKSAHSKGLEFIYDIEPLPKKLIGDSYRIKQILNNLLGNALKFTDFGHIGLSASGTVLAHGLFELNIKIEDTGIGISREDKRKLFTAFSQVDDALNRSYQGTGLGLVICKELVKLMRGHLMLQSIPGQGSIFQVTMRTNLADAQPTLSLPNEWQGATVLLYDPYPNSRHSTSKLLCQLGAQVTSVESLAYLKMRHEHYDYLFACLPGTRKNCRQGALDMLAHIDADKVVLFHSDAEFSLPDRGLPKGFNTQFRLPVTLGKLSEIIRRPTENPVDKLQQRLRQLPPARVLAVDDMEMNLRLLRTWLKPSPLILDLAFSGQEALEQCKHKDFDLILMDVQMPHMDGLEATRLIRQTELNIGTPIIAVTAHAFKEEQERLLASGMDDFLPKPLNLSDLVTLINRWCGSAKLSTEVPVPIPVILDQQVQTTQLTSFDWQLAQKRAHHNTQAAREVFAQFIVQLPELLADMELNAQRRDFSQLQATVHKLHGACCYTGVPLLHWYCGETESLLKRQELEKSLHALAKLIGEASTLLAQAQNIKRQISA